jgi:hypothetical protein
MNPVLLALALIQFTGPTGHRIDVNPAEVSSVREIAEPKYWGPGVHCVLVMVGNKFIGVHETCAVARKALANESADHGPCVLMCGDSHRR